MEKFEVTILGCGSAMPTLRHSPSSQVVDVRGKLFMLDCGEGTQVQMRRARLGFARLNHIFISHIHGDHCFGLPGLLSTLNLLGHTAEIHVHGPQGLEEMISPMLDNQAANFRVVFQPFDTHEPAVIYDDRSLTVTTIPLSHRVPCCGFLMSEKPSLPHVLKEMIDFHEIPYSQINRIKAGADYVTPDGLVIPNAELTRPAEPPRRYAYVTDTLCLPGVAEQVRGVDLLYHEATFAHNNLPLARATFHSTALQAAQQAKVAGVGRLLIGHFSDRYPNEHVLLDEARAVFPNTMLAQEMLQVPVRSEED